ncbi:MAG: hypothetical protein WAK18_13315 [Nocardioidaceae bacterium]
MFPALTGALLMKAGEPARRRGARAAKPKRTEQSSRHAQPAPRQPE